MSGFDTVVIVDWSARSQPSPRKPSADAIWVAVAGDSGTTCHYLRTRHEAMTFLRGLFDAELSAGRRVLAGFDFPFAYPRGFARAVTGQDDPLTLWAALAARIIDAPDNSNNRFEVARDINRLFPGTGPFWGCPADEADAVLPAKGSARHDHGLPARRGAEDRLPSSQPCWKLYTTGSVGSQALLGLPHLHALRQAYGTALSVAPFQAPDTSLVLAEVYPSLLAGTVTAAMQKGEIKDRAQVRVLAEALHRLDAGRLDAMLREGDALEGWILGLGHEDALRAAFAGSSAAALPAPPPLRDDCFSLPAGVDWTPVDDALRMLQERLHPVTGAHSIGVAQALGRVLAQDAIAQRSHPPTANSAVDGYGFAHAALPDGDALLALVDGRAAAGVPYAGRVPQGMAIRILTGAALPEGVDTVVLEEDVTVGAGRIAFRGGLKPRANARRAGEDVKAGQTVLPAGRILTPADLGLLSAVGIGTLLVRDRLRVAVMSTGDELVEPGQKAGDGQIYDANRPMLLGLLRQFGFEPVDMGRIPDDRKALGQAFDRAAEQADAILTSGGASAGDEDHVSALLTETGSMAEWRIALKPGRPLALGIWGGCPVFGLPGNPVAALVCTLIFARPALGLMSGAGWFAPQAFDMPAAFEKRKKPGRREYLRARIRAGHVEIFASEGSGRISGLSWAEGLVELDDGARHVRPGDRVRYIPYASFLG